MVDALPTIRRPARRAAVTIAAPICDTAGDGPRPAAAQTRVHAPSPIRPSSHKDDMALSIEDQLAIQQLVARYNHAIDSGDAAAYADTFTDDGVLDAGDLVLCWMRGALCLRRRLSPYRSGPAPHRQQRGHRWGRRPGQLRAYVQLFGLAGEPPRQEVRASGIYTDTLVKEDGRWRFVRRTFVNDATTPPPS